MAKGILALEDDTSPDDTTPKDDQTPSSDSTPSEGTEGSTDQGVTSDENNEFSDVEPNEEGDITIELGEDEDAMEVVSNALDNADDDLETLVQIDDKVNQSEDPLTPTEQKIVEIAVESIHRSLGYKRKTVAFESIDGKPQLSQEGIGSTIFNTIRSKCAHLEWLFESIVKTEKKYAKKLEILQTHLTQAISNSSSKGGEIKASDYKNIVLGNTASAKDIVKNIQDYTKHIKSVNYEKAAVEITNEFGKLTGLIRSVWIYSNKNEVKQLDTIISDISKSTLSLVGTQVKAGTFVFGIGNKIGVTIISNDDDNVVSIQSTKIESDNDHNDKTFAAPTADEVKAILVAVEDLIAEQKKRLNALTELAKKAKNTSGWQAINTMFRPGQVIANVLTQNLYEATDLRRAAAAMRSVGVLRDYYVTSFRALEHIVSDVVRLAKNS